MCTVCPSGTSDKNVMTGESGQNFHTNISLLPASDGADRLAERADRDRRSFPSPPRSFYCEVFCSMLVYVSSSSHKIRPAQCTEKRKVTLGLVAFIYHIISFSYRLFSEHDITLRDERKLPSEAPSGLKGDNKLRKRFWKFFWFVLDDEERSAPRYRHICFHRNLFFFCLQKNFFGKYLMIARSAVVKKMEWGGESG